MVLAIILIIAVILLLASHAMSFYKAMPTKAEELAEDAFVIGHGEAEEITIAGIRYKAPTKQAGLDFGAAVDSNDDYVVIAAPGYGRKRANNASGAVYVFRKGKLVKTVTSPAPYVQQRFGSHVAIEDDNKLVIQDRNGKSYRVSLC